MPRSEPNAFWSIENLGPIGMVAGTRRGELFRATGDGGWVSLGASESASTVYLIARLGNDGFLYGGQDGVLTFRFIDGPVCETFNPGADAVFDAVPHAGGFLARGIVGPAGDLVIQLNP